MHIGELSPPSGAKKRRRRVGRGMGSGVGKTSGRGMKGQNARTSVRPGFEGGQTPLYRRLPKRRGVSQAARNIGIFRREHAEINVGQLEKHFDAGAEVTPQLLVERGLIRKVKDGLRVLGDGELHKALTVRAHHFTASARGKIETAGGTAEVI
ncbi:MAG: 50S ribosomal protein L15 [Armatimonadetes bacterium]|nr:50S ribosomal protein L15 [Armatimonadota bacterium]